MLSTFKIICERFAEYIMMEKASFLIILAYSMNLMVAGFFTLIILNIEASLGSDINHDRYPREISIGDKFVPLRTYKDSVNFALKTNGFRLKSSSINISQLRRDKFSASRTRQKSLNPESSPYSGISSLFIDEEQNFTQTGDLIKDELENDEAGKIPEFVDTLENYSKKRDIGTLYTRRSPSVQGSQRSDNYSDGSSYARFPELTSVGRKARKNEYLTALQNLYERGLHDAYIFVHDWEQKYKSQIYHLFNKTYYNQLIKYNSETSKEDLGQDSLWRQYLDGRKYSENQVDTDKIILDVDLFLSELNDDSSIVPGEEFFVMLYTDHDKQRFLNNLEELQSNLIFVGWVDLTYSNKREVEKKIENLHKNPMQGQELGSDKLVDQKSTLLETSMVNYGSVCIPVDISLLEKTGEVRLKIISRCKINTIMHIGPYQCKAKVIPCVDISPSSFKGLKQRPANEKSIANQLEISNEQFSTESELNFSGADSYTQQAEALLNDISSLYDMCSTVEFKYFTSIDDVRMAETVGRRAKFVERLNEILGHYTFEVSKEKLYEIVSFFSLEYHADNLSKLHALQLADTLRRLIFSKTVLTKKLEHIHRLMTLNRVDKNISFKNS